MIRKLINTQIIGLITVSFLFIGIVSGQNKIDGYSINPKLGYFFSAENIDGPIVGIEVNALKNKMIFSVDYYYAQHNVISFSYPITTYNQLDFLFGKYFEENLFRFQYQVGLGAFWGVKPGDLINKGSGFFSG